MAEEMGDVIKVLEDCETMVEDLCEVLEVLKEIDEDGPGHIIPGDGSEGANLTVLDGTDIATTLGDTVKEVQSDSSLAMANGVTIRCPLAVIKHSEYLLDMSKAFDSNKELPVPAIVELREMNKIIQLTEMTENLPETQCQEVTDGFLASMDLEEILNLLLAADFLSSSVSKYVEEVVIRCVTVSSWSRVFSSCYAVMGLKKVQEFLLNFFLHCESDSDGERVQLTGDIPVHFIKSVVNQRTFEIREEDKIDLVLDWAAKNTTNSEDDIYECLELIKLKCFEECDSLEQLKVDVSQVLFLNQNEKNNFLLAIDEAINFKKEEWDLCFVYLPRKKNKRNLRDLNIAKSMLPWPKLIGLLPNPGSNEPEKFELLNNRNLQIQGKLSQMSSLMDKVNIECLLCYRTSVFFVSFSDLKNPQLCQTNFDLNLTFHVLDLPSCLRSINDDHNRRSSSFSICHVNHFLYLIAVDAFCPMTYDTPEKRGVFRINLDLAVESCNQALAIENASLLQWEQFTEIPEEYLISSPNMLFNSDTIKTVGVGRDLFILNDDICVSLNVDTRIWKEIELAPPARSNPVVFGSDTELFVLGGSCMGRHLVSGQKYNTRTWKMELLPNIPAGVMLRQDLKNYHGLYHCNKLYLSYSRTFSQDKCGIAFSPTEKKPLLVYDMFLKQWESHKVSNNRLFRLDKPIWM